MSEEKLAALLGRPLTTIETTNRKTYLKIAKEQIESLTCLNLDEETSDRVYDVRSGYTTVFTDLFTDVNSVTINGSAFTDYSPRQWNRRNAAWNNSIVLTTYADEITVNADWGICSPELELLTAKLFALVSSMNNGNGNVKSKRVEDFTITFNENSVYDQFLIDNTALINRYSICGISQVRNGEVCDPCSIYRPRFY